MFDHSNKNETRAQRLRDVHFLASQLLFLVSFSLHTPFLCLSIPAHSLQDFALIGFYLQHDLCIALLLSPWALHEFPLHSGLPRLHCLKHIYAEPFKSGFPFLQAFSDLIHIPLMRLCKKKKPAKHRDLSLSVLWPPSHKALCFPTSPVLW